MYYNKEPTKKEQNHILLRAVSSLFSASVFSTSISSSSEIMGLPSSS